MIWRFWEKKLGTYKYKAFISYSWVDKAWANWILRALEHYRTPKTLVGRETPLGRVPVRLRPLFKDREEEAASAGIGSVVEQALDNSEFLIVVCSPHSATSDWVNREIAYFKANRNPDKVLTLVVDGEPGASLGTAAPDTECFPAAILNRVDAAGEITGDREDLPLAADARPEGDGKRNAKLKLAAAMLGVGLDELVRREDKRRATQRLAVTAITSTIALITSGLAITAAIARNDAVLAQQLAEHRRDEAEGLIEFMITDMRQELDAVGRLDVLDKTAQRALDYYTAQDTRGLDPDALGRRARAQLLFGEVHNARGNLEAALTAYQQAAATTEEQLRRDPVNPDRIFDHSQSLFWVGYIAWQRGDTATAREHFTQYYEHADALVRMNPENQDWKIELMYAHSNLGTLELGDGNAAEAAEQFQNALTLAETLFGNEPEDAQSILELGQSYAWLADAHFRQLNLDLGNRARHTEAEIYARGLDKFPDHAEIQDSLVVTKYNLAQFSLALGEPDSALDHAREAVLIAKALIRAEPENVRWSDRTAYALAVQGDTYLALGQFQLADTALSEATTVARDLVANDPSVVQWKGHILAHAMLMSAHLDLAMGRTASGLARFEETQALIEDDALSDDADFDVVWRYCAALAGSARLAPDRQHHWDQIVLLIEQQALKDDPNALTLLSEAYLKSGRVNEAKAIVQRLNTLGYRHHRYVAFLLIHPELGE